MMYETHALQPLNQIYAQNFSHTSLFDTLFNRRTYHRHTYACSAFAFDVVVCVCLSVFLSGNHSLCLAHSHRVHFYRNFCSTHIQIEACKVSTLHSHTHAHKHTEMENRRVSIDEFHLFSCCTCVCIGIYHMQADGTHNFVLLPIMFAISANWMMAE